MKGDPARKVPGAVLVGFVWRGTGVLPGEERAGSGVLQHWATGCSLVLSLGHSALALGAHRDRR